MQRLGFCRQIASLGLGKNQCFWRYSSAVAMSQSTNVTEARHGLLLGMYEGEEKGDSYALTKAARGFANEKAQQLVDLIKVSGLEDNKAKIRTYFGVSDRYPTVAVVNIGKKSASYNTQEQRDDARENIRNAVAAGVKQLSENGVETIFVDPISSPEAAAEAAYLSVYNIDFLKAEDKRKKQVKVQCFIDYVDDSFPILSQWDAGQVTAEGQNLARFLMDSPANRMTPTEFAKVATEKFSKLDKCKVIVRDESWAVEQGMGAYLSVARGSDEPLKFVEVHYNGGLEDNPPLALVGKGITFDSGGVSLKPSAGMDEMKADMGGAAVLLGSLYAAAKLKMPINIKGFFPLCENMINGKATKPGDVVTSMSGKTIEVDNTDAEGRLILCDALTYAQTFKPFAIMDMATLTGAMMVALGSAASGVFSNSDEMWNKLQKAGEHTGDRMWRMPLFKHYSKQMEGKVADLNNLGNAGRQGGACTAAAFLKEFVTSDNWMHIDIAGVMSHKSEYPYLGAGMSGRPTRTIVEFIRKLT